MPSNRQVPVKPRHQGREPLLLQVSTLSNHRAMPDSLVVSLLLYFARGGGALC